MYVNFCDELGPLITIVRYVVMLIRWGIPIILIVLGMIDFGKAVLAGKEEDQKKAQGILIKRCIYAVSIFVIVSIVTLLFKIVSDSTGGEGFEQDWRQCWDDALL